MCGYVLSRLRMKNNNSIRFTITPPHNLTEEQLIPLQSHMFLSKGNRNIDIDNV